MTAHPGRPPRTERSNHRAGVRWRFSAAVALVALALSGTAHAQGTGIYYQEVRKDGVIYVFSTAARYQEFQASGEVRRAITLAGRGPAGETVVAEDENALNLFLFKHDLPPEKGSAAKPEEAPKAVPPLTLKVGEGQIKVGTLLQPWYVYDSSPRGTATSYYRNIQGYDTFTFRRAELRVSGTVTPTWAFYMMIDAAKSQTFTASGVPVTDDKILQDLEVTFLGLKGHQFGLGQGKIPITEEGLRSSAELDFVERARVTRLFSDRRETGFFYRGQFGDRFAAYASVTNGTPSNVPNYDEALFGSARVDVKPTKGILLGVSGGTTVGGSVGEITRDVVNGFFKAADVGGLPLGVEAEYVAATTGQAGKPDVRANGWYGTLIYTFAGAFQLGLRYDLANRNLDVPGNRVTTWSGGLKYLIRGKNMNLTLDWFRVDEEGRKVGGVLSERYDQAIFQAQVAF